MTTVNSSKLPSNDDHTCSVCFKNVDIFSVGSCDHPICHECSTRMRILCKEDLCPICRQELTKVLFVKQVIPFNQLRFSNFLFDKKSGIYFEDLNIKNEFLKLLDHPCQFCPSRPTFSNLELLKDHLRKEHEKFFCDLCLNDLKIFTWERRAYSRQELALHRRKGDPDNTSHRGHPLCNFCDQRYIDSDELYRHLRREHFFCHFCDADGLNQYYCMYEDLRDHFREAHFLCEEGICKEEKFTGVFRTEIDYRAHRAQAHSQSLGKAAVKQARTLELEFTVTRPSENKGRSGRRPAPRSAKERQPAVPQEEPPPVAVPPPAPADIKNPQEFPSLSTANDSNPIVPKKNTTSDSLAQKLAKSNRFTVRNSGDSGGDEEFPSLVPSKISTDSTSSEPTRIKHSLHVKVSHQKPTGSNVKPAPSQINSKEEAVGQTRQHAAPKVGGPLPTGARVTRISSSKNIRLQPSGSSFDADFPSLQASGGSALDENTASSSGWVEKTSEKSHKKQPAKVPTSTKVARQVSDKNEFPELVPSNRQISPLANQSVIHRATLSTANQNFIHKAPLSTVNTTDSSTKANAGNKKKKNGSKQLQDLDSNGIPSLPKDVEKKISQLSDLKLSSVTPSAKVQVVHEMAAVSNAPKPTINGSGVKPKIKNQTVSLNQSQFPALVPSPSSTKLLSTRFDQDSLQLFTPKPPPPEPTPVSDFTPKNNQSTSPVIFPESGEYFYLQPPDFATRNQQLVATVMDLLCSQPSKMEQFRTLSNRFRNSLIEAKDYYQNCLEIIGDDYFHALFPELVCLLPDIEKQQNLLRVHRSEVRKRGSLGTEPYVICASCQQVLVPSDLKHHINSHSLDTHFPALSTAPSSAPCSKQKRS